MTYDPWRDAADRHPDVHIERIPMGQARGAWIASEQVIFIECSLDRASRRTVLSHELAHIDLDHSATARGWFSRRQERQADDLAAERLIDLDDLASALTWAQSQEEVAAELEVTVDVLRRRVRTLTKAEVAYIHERLWGRTA